MSTKYNSRTHGRAVALDCITLHMTPEIVFRSQVLDCPRLMETVLSEFLPTSWTAPSPALPQSVYGLPLASAMKLLRVLATAGRHACARLVSAAVEFVGAGASSSVS